MNLAEQLSNARPVNVGKPGTANLLGNFFDALNDAQADDKKIPPGDNSPNDVHDVHNVHTDDPDEDVPENLDDAIPDDELTEAIATVEAALKACVDDPGVLASADFLAAARLVRERDQSEWLRIRVALKKAKPSGVLLSEIDKGTAPEGEGFDDSSVADDLVALVQGRAELFHAEDGACFVALKESPRKVFKLDTAAFSEWLGYAYYRNTESDTRPGRAASETAIRTARSVLAGIAKNDGQERKTWLRAAEHNGTYYLDLGADDWCAVEIDARGWRVVEHPPVYFWRASTTRPLPMPIRGGNLAKLWDHVNVPEASRPLVLAWKLETLRPETPFPVLELVGPQGSAKSSTQAKIRRCVDPNAVDLRAAPKSVEDLFVSAGCNWVASLNNLSRLSPQIQDAICNLATGGGFAGRTLYTNADESVIDAKRPVILNGIVPLVTAQDLTDRVIHIELPSIGAYRSETEINAGFERDLPSIVGGLLDLFVLTLAKIPDARVPSPPRMADFALLGEAMTLATGGKAGDFMAIYSSNRKDSVARSLESSPVAVAIRSMADAHKSSGPVFVGTMGALKAALDLKRDNAEAWPKSPRGLGDVLRRQLPALAQIGIKIEIGKAGRDGVQVTIRKCEHCEHGERRSDGYSPGEKFLDDTEAF
ncbi:MAG: hypothetical protein EOM22_10440 [Gammaproteobacteria bacterium]|jgi:hypothetical protein|nr:hypothetical protein [Gammaproteobacteria bacterium]